MTLSTPLTFLQSTYPYQSLLSKGRTELCLGDVNFSPSKDKAVPAWTWFLGGPRVEASCPWLRNWNLPSGPVILSIWVARLGCAGIQVAFLSSGSGQHSLWPSPKAKGGGRLWGDLGPLGRHSSFQNFITFSITVPSLQGGKSQLVAEDTLNVLLFSTLPPAQAAGSWADTSLRRTGCTVGQCDIVEPFTPRD